MSRDAQAAAPSHAQESAAQQQQQQQQRGPLPGATSGSFTFEGLPAALRQHFGDLPEDEQHAADTEEAARMFQEMMRQHMQRHMQHLRAANATGGPNVMIGGHPGGAAVMVQINTAPGGMPNFFGM